MAHPDVLAAMSEGARRAGLAGEIFRGICHSKATLFAREFGHGPAGERNRSYREELARAGVVASEMEASTLFVLAATAGPWCGPLDGNWDEECQAGAVLAVFGTDHSDMKLDPQLPQLAEQRAIDVAIEGTRIWARRDRRAAGRQVVKVAAWVAAVLAAAVAALLVPTLFLTPYSVDHFYTRLVLPVRLAAAAAAEPAAGSRAAAPALPQRRSQRPVGGVPDRRGRLGRAPAGHPAALRPQRAGARRAGLLRHRGVVSGRRRPGAALHAARLPGKPVQRRPVEPARVHADRSPDRRPARRPRLRRTDRPASTPPSRSSARASSCAAGEASWRRRSCCAWCCARCASSSPSSRQRHPLYLHLAGRLERLGGSAAAARPAPRQPADSP